MKRLPRIYPVSIHSPFPILYLCKDSRLSIFPPSGLLETEAESSSFCPTVHAAKQNQSRAFSLSLLHCYSAWEGKFLQNPFIDDQTRGLTSFLLFVIFISLHSLGHFGKKFLFSTSPLIIQEKKSHAV